MAWYIKGVKLGTANVKVSYTSGAVTKTADISGGVNVVTLTTTDNTTNTNPVGNTITITRTGTLNKISANGELSGYYVNGGTQTVTIPAITAHYTVAEKSTTIYYKGFKNTPTFSGASAVTVTASTISNGAGTITFTVPSSSAVSAGVSSISENITIKDGSSNIKTITISSGSVSGTSSVSVSNSGLTVSSGNTSYFTAEKTSDNKLKLTATGGNGTTGSSAISVNYGGKSVNIGTQYKVAIGYNTGCTTTSTTLERGRILTGIAATGGSDNVSVLVGSEQSFTQPSSITASYSIDSTGKTATIYYTGCNGYKPVLSDANGNVTFSAGNNNTAGQLTITSSTSTSKTGTSYITGKINNMDIIGLGSSGTHKLSVTVSNPNTSETISSGWTYTDGGSDVIDVVEK
jgi:hypothetical protein